MPSTLGDVESEGYYRRLASTVPKDIIFEALSLVKRAVHEGKIRKSRGALFVAIVKRTCAEREYGILVGTVPSLPALPPACRAYADIGANVDAAAAEVVQENRLPFISCKPPGADPHTGR